MEEERFEVVGFLKVSAVEDTEFRARPYLPMRPVQFVMQLSTIAGDGSTMRL
jgi:hypothetical protein